jgi:hypothetical protein
MKALLVRLLRLGSAALVIAVLGNGLMHLDYSGANPSSLGLTRLQRDLAESRLVRARSKMVQNIVPGAGDNH